MNRRIVILGDDEFLSDEGDSIWALVLELRKAGVVVETVLTDDEGMTQAINAALA